MSSPPEKLKNHTADDLIALGKSTLRVSRIGVGTWAWGDRTGWGYGQSYDEKDLEQSFLASTDAGVVLFDTAERYGGGLAEKFLGQFAKNHQRNVVIATKFSPSRLSLRRKDLFAALRGSLGRLGLERVGLFQIHWPSRLVSIERRMVALADTVEEGLAQAVGVSNYSLDEFRRAHDALARKHIALASIQLPYSLVRRDHEFDGILEECRQRGVSFIAYSPLAMGILTGKYTHHTQLSGVKVQVYESGSLEKFVPVLECVRQIGQSHGGKTVAQVALNYLMCKGVIPLAGAKNGRQARENAGALGWRLHESDIARLDTESLALR